MSDAASKGHSSPPGGFREVVGFGRSASLMAKGLDRAIRRFADRLKQDFSQQIGEDAKGFKKLVLRRIRSYLPPGPGRPVEAAVTKAVELRKQGLDWKQIYTQC